MNRAEDPCYFCNKRYAGCHGECDKYKASLLFKAEIKRKQHNEQIAKGSSGIAWNYDHRGKKK